MAKTREKKERIGFVSILVFLAMIVVCYFCLVAILMPERYDVAIGSVSEKAITSPRAIEDTAVTEALREAARNKTGAVYKLDTDLAETYISDAAAFFHSLRAFRQSAAVLRATRSMGTGLPEDGVLPAESWESLIGREELYGLLGEIPLDITAEEGYYLLSAEDNELLRLQDAVLPKLTTSLESGQDERLLQARLTACKQELNATTLDKRLVAIGEKAFENYLRPTFVLDERETEEAKAKAALAVQPKEIRRGDVIVEEGAVVTEAQYDILRRLELVRFRFADMRLYIGTGVLLACLFLMLYIYLLRYRRAILASPKKMIITGVAAALTMLLSLALNALGRIPAALIGVMLIALLVDGRAAMMVNVVLSFCVALMAGGRGATMLGYDSMVTAWSMIAGGQVAVYLLGRSRSRSSIILMGLFAGMAAAVVPAVAGIMTIKTAAAILLGAGWTIGANLLYAIFVVGTLAVWENIFDIATDARLNELSNANNPLLKQLMAEAPGTYHHSMMTASLAESAAEAIGADPLLCRVGAYYHDVGKLRRPLYFKENQKSGENIHDTLPAAESAAIIIAHLKDGVALLKRHKLPSSVVQIALEHHGTTMAAYFYHKAVKEAGGKPVNQKNFRYPGARPGTKESAIVHLADSCEAAVRSLDNPAKEAVEEIVVKIIRGKIDDGQLAAAPLAFKDIALIQLSFLRTFTGMMHERIAYPEPLAAIEGKS
ncbi:MAG: HDIG domain-containing protein [Clostridiales bacterium]|jgi:putative nucleotidyltransferase with HDIG domain|nr:HDIG domain-containing protein [Clostridiales bacterium]